MVNFTDNNTLANMLESDALGDNCLDIIELHGYLTAALISPVETTTEELLTEVLGQDASAIASGIRDILLSEIVSYQSAISRELLAAEAIELPCELSVGESDDEPSELERWCMAFVEKHLIHESEWFLEDQAAVAEMMLPIWVTSGLFDDEEITAIRQKETLFISMVEQIPEVVVDLYAFFHQD